MCACVFGSVVYRVVVPVVQALPGLTRVAADIADSDRLDAAFAAAGALDAVVHLAARYGA